MKKLTWAAVLLVLALLLAQVSFSLAAGPGQTTGPSHNLAVTSFDKLFTGEVAPGATISFSFTVANQGTFTETFNWSVKATPGNVAIDSGQYTLRPGFSLKGKISWRTTGVVPGQYQVTLSAGPVAGETKVDDNTRSVTVVFSSTATTTMTAVPLSVGAAVAHDLEVKSFAKVSPVGSVVVGQMVGFSFEITNNGTSAETFAWNAIDQTDGVTIDSVTGNGLRPGFSLLGNLSWNTAGRTLGDHSVRLEVPPVPGETLTTNNIRTTTVTIILQPSHDVAVTAVRAPAAITSGGVQIVQVDIANRGNVAETPRLDLTDRLTGAGTTPTTIFSGNLSIEATSTATFLFQWDARNIPGGAHTLTATLTLPSGVVDEVPGNNTATTTVNVTVTTLLKQGVDQTYEQTLTPVTVDTLAAPVTTFFTSGVERSYGQTLAGVTVDTLAAPVTTFFTSGVERSYGQTLAGVTVDTLAAPLTTFFSSGVERSYGQTLAGVTVDTLAAPGTTFFSSGVEQVFNLGFGPDPLIAQGMISGTVRLQGHEGTHTLSHSSLGAFIVVVGKVFFARVDGTFSIDLLPGTYNIIFMAPGYLPIHLTGVQVTSAGIVLQPLLLVFGDYNGDGKIDLLDVTALAANFGKTSQ